MSHPPATAIATRNVLLLLLACAAGYVDAVSYVGLGRVFTANMTGNTVLLGLALVQADSQAALRSGLALTGFLIGGVLGAWIIARSRSEGVWPPTVTAALALEGSFLLAFAVGWQVTIGASPPPVVGLALIVLSALAMGVQSAAVRRLDVLGIATTYITGTLTSLVIRLVGERRGAGATAHTRHCEAMESPVPPARSVHGTGLLAAVWLVYIGGAVAAAIAMRRDQVLVVALPIAVILIVIVTAVVCFRR
jgi:uncharacterized membrane protein YoaK (UPF0700 family)